MRINLLPGAQSSKTSLKTVIPKANIKPVIKPSNPVNDLPVKTIENIYPDDVKLEEIPLGEMENLVQSKPKKSSSLSNILIYICWAVFLLGSLVFVLGEYFDYDLAKGELLSLDNQIAEYRTYLDKEEAAKVRNLEIRQPDLRLAFLTHLYQPWLAVFNDLASVLPEDLWLTGIEGTSQGKLTVNGRSLTYNAVGDYVSNLEGIPLFQIVQLKEVHRVSSKIPDYTFTIEIEAGGNGLE